jgi:hypothetical protein
VSRDGDVHRRTNRRQLNLDRRFAQLLDAACAHRGAIAYEAGGFPIPLRIDPVDRVLQHGGGAGVVLGRDEDETVGRRDCGGPSLYDLVLVRRATLSLSEAIADEADRLLRTCSGLPFNQALTWATAIMNQLVYVTVEAEHLPNDDSRVHRPYR